MVLYDSDKIIFIINFNTIIFFRIGQGNFQRSVCTAVVYDNIFEVPVCLPQNASMHSGRKDAILYTGVTTLTNG
jgi:hypothetical protein